MNSWSPFRKVWGLLTPPERRRGTMLFGLMVVGMGLETLGVGMVIPTVALLMEPDLAATYPALEPLLLAVGNPDPATLAIAVMLTLVAVYAFKAAFLGFLAWRQTSFAYSVQAQLSQRLFSKYLHQPYTFHLQRNSAELIRVAVSDVNTFTFQVMIPAITLLSETLVLAGLGTLLVIIEPTGALIVLSVLSVASWAMYRVIKVRLSRWGAARQLHEGKRIQHLQEGLGGAKEVKLLGREAEFLREYAVHNLGSARAGQLHLTMTNLPRLWLEMLAIVGLASLVLTMVVQGRDMAQVLPTMGVFAAAAFRLMPSANRTLSALQAMRFGAPVISVLSNELRIESTPSQGGEAQERPLSRTLEFRKVSYTYPGAAAQSLRELSLEIHCGESVGIIGPSGAGKSTLVDVMLGLLTPGTGDVLVDGEDIQPSLRSWQDQIGYVPQSIFLTDDTLRRNVAFGLSESGIEDDLVWKALAAAQLQEFVAALPDGLETMVGERGVRLSGGQRQRIGIARALYLDPTILVLDEATSSLDSETESEVMEAVYALRGSRTIVIVAHRLGTVSSCDRLYRLENGRVIEMGTPKTILSRLGNV